MLVTGRYFADRKVRRSHKTSYDTAIAARLWEVSAGLVGVRASEGPPAAWGRGRRQAKRNEAPEEMPPPGDDAAQPGTSVMRTNGARRR